MALFYPSIHLIEATYEALRLGSCSRGRGGGHKMRVSLFLVTVGAGKGRDVSSNFTFIFRKEDL